MWQVEVDYGRGWLPYGPPYTDEGAAQDFAHELARHGHGVHVVRRTAIKTVADDAHPATKRRPGSGRKRKTAPSLIELRIAPPQRGTRDRRAGQGTRV